MTFVSPKFAGVSEDAQAFRSKWGIRGQGEMRQPVRWLVARGAGTFFSVMVGRAPGLRRVRSDTGWVWGALACMWGRIVEKIRAVVQIRVDPPRSTQYSGRTLLRIFCEPDMERFRSSSGWIRDGSRVWFSLGSDW